jgi:L-alanine-DL-glutamate epimerase-like enolase superfamily enzyme
MDLMVELHGLWSRRAAERICAGAGAVPPVPGGGSGARRQRGKVATPADAFGVPVAPHDCTGPVSLAACLHLELQPGLAERPDVVRRVTGSV